MNSSNLIPRIQQRTRRYFDRYEHCLRVYLHECHCLRGLDHDRIDKVARLRQEWGRRMQKQPQPGSWYWATLEITDTDISYLHAMCDHLQSEKRDYKMIISGSWFFIYTNESQLIADVANLSWLDPQKMQWSRVDLIGGPGTIVRKQAQHRRRTYLRSVQLDSKQKKSLANLIANAEYLRASPALQQFLDRDSLSKVHDYYFIDHDDDRWLLMLALIRPGLIRKTLDIVEHK